jgi:predicted AlkP superfamily pyrophosphatase or phosphodiesterase
MNTPTQLKGVFPIEYRGRKFEFDYIPENVVDESTVEIMYKCGTKPKKVNVTIINGLSYDLWIQDRIKMVRLLSTHSQNGVYYQIILKEVKQ